MEDLQKQRTLPQATQKSPRNGKASSPSGGQRRIFQNSVSALLLKSRKSKKSHVTIGSGSFKTSVDSAKSKNIQHEAMQVSKHSPETSKSEPNNSGGKSESVSQSSILQSKISTEFATASSCNFEGKRNGVVNFARPSSRGRGRGLLLRKKWSFNMDGFLSQDSSCEPLGCSTTLNDQIPLPEVHNRDTSLDTESVKRSIKLEAVEDPETGLAQTLFKRLVLKDDKSDHPRLIIGQTDRDRPSSAGGDVDSNTVPYSLEFQNSGQNVSNDKMGKGENGEKREQVPSTSVQNAQRESIPNTNGIGDHVTKKEKQASNARENKSCSSIKTLVEKEPENVQSFKPFRDQCKPIDSSSKDAILSKFWTHTLDPRPKTSAHNVKKDSQPLERPKKPHKKPPVRNGEKDNSQRRKGNPSPVSSHLKRLDVPSVSFQGTPSLSKSEEAPLKPKEANKKHPRVDKSWVGAVNIAKDTNRTRTILSLQQSAEDQIETVTCMKKVSTFKDSTRLGNCCAQSPQSASESVSEKVAALYHTFKSESHKNMKHGHARESFELLTRPALKSTSCEADSQEEFQSFAYNNIRQLDGFGIKSVDKNIANDDCRGIDKNVSNELRSHRNKNPEMSVKEELGVLNKTITMAEDRADSVRDHFIVQQEPVLGLSKRKLDQKGAGKEKTNCNLQENGQNSGDNCGKEKIHKSMISIEDLDRNVNLSKSLSEELDKGRMNQNDWVELTQDVRVCCNHQAENTKDDDVFEAVTFSVHNTDISSVSQPRSSVLTSEDEFLSGKSEEIVSSDESPEPNGHFNVTRQYFHHEHHQHQDHSDVHIKKNLRTFLHPHSSSGALQPPTNSMLPLSTNSKFSTDQTKPNLKTSTKQGDRINSQSDTEHFIPAGIDGSGSHEHYGQEQYSLERRYPGYDSNPYWHPGFNLNNGYHDCYHLERTRHYPYGHPLIKTLDRLRIPAEAFCESNTGITNFLHTCSDQVEKCTRDSPRHLLPVQAIITVSLEYSTPSPDYNSCINPDEGSLYLPSHAPAHSLVGFSTPFHQVPYHFWQQGPLPGWNGWHSHHFGKPRAEAGGVYLPPSLDHPKQLNPQHHELPRLPGTGLSQYKSTDSLYPQMYSCPAGNQPSQEEPTLATHKESLEENPTLEMSKRTAANASVSQVVDNDGAQHAKKLQKREPLTDSNSLDWIAGEIVQECNIPATPVVMTKKRQACQKFVARASPLSISSFLTPERLQNNHWKETPAVMTVKEEPEIPPHIRYSCSPSPVQSSSFSTFKGSIDPQQALVNRSPTSSPVQSSTFSTFKGIIDPQQTLVNGSPTTRSGKESSEAYETSLDKKGMLRKSAGVHTHDYSHFTPIPGYDVSSGEEQPQVCKDDTIKPRSTSGAFPTLSQNNRQPHMSSALPRFVATPLGAESSNWRVNCKPLGHESFESDNRSNECTKKTVRDTRRRSDLINADKNLRLESPALTLPRGFRGRWSDSALLKSHTVTYSKWLCGWKAQSKTYQRTFIDTHCHIDFIFQRMPVAHTKPFDKFIQERSQFFPDNYEGCVAVFCRPRTFDSKKPDNTILKMVEQDPKVWVALGCHPKSAEDFQERHLIGLRSALKSPKVVALGEIGLDYSGQYGRFAETQKKVFITQLKLALEMDLPLIIHCRDADDDCLEIMKKVVPREHKIHAHCFTRGLAVACRWLEPFPNLWLGFTPLISYGSAKDAMEAATHVPLTRILLETDAPYFVPNQCKSDTHHSLPGFALFTAETIASLKKISVDTVLEHCRKNTKDMYGI